MAGEVEIAAFVIGLIPDQGFQHADHLRAFFIDGGGVEIVDLHKTFRADGVRQRAIVFTELARAQLHHV